MDRSVIASAPPVGDDIGQVMRRRAPQSSRHAMAKHGRKREHVVDDGRVDSSTGRARQAASALAARGPVPGDVLLRFRTRCIGGRRAPAQDGLDDAFADGSGGQPLACSSSCAVITGTASLVDAGRRDQHAALGIETG